MTALYFTPNFIKAPQLTLGMSYLVIVLIVISSFTSSYWNFRLKESIKKGADNVLLYWLSYISGVIIYAIFFLYLINQSKISYQGLMLSVLCGLTFAVYAFSVGKSYELSDLSHAFPLSKITPLFTLLIGVFVLKETVTLTALGGIILIILGVYGIHLQNFSLKNALQPIISLKHKGSIFALATALISAVYGLIFKLSIGKIDQFVFIYLAYLFSTIFYLPFLFYKKKGILAEFKKYKMQIIQIGILDMFGAILVLWAVSLSNLSYVFALRQMSILFTVFAGIYIFNEPYGKTRLISSLVIILGIIILSANI